MCGFLLRIIMNAIVLYSLMALLPGMFVDTLGSILLGAVIIGIANASIRPLLNRVSLPFNGLTLGGVTCLINLFTPLMVVKTLPGFQLASLQASLAGFFLMTVCSFTLSKVIQDR